MHDVALGQLIPQNRPGNELSDVTATGAAHVTLEPDKVPIV
jgi:hypothetical protein